MNIHEKVLGVVKRGRKWNISFHRHSVRCNNHNLIVDGCVRDEDELGITIPETREEIIAELERLYDRYNHSVPSEATDGKNKVPVLSEKDLSDEDMCFGEQRGIAQFEFEYFVLCMTLTRPSDILMKKEDWFWISENHPKLVILKPWFINN